MVFDVIVIGGGAAGFFSAIHAAEFYPGSRILIVEKSPKLLSKVRVSGGGRCNVTHHCFDSGRLATHYPRGEKALRKVFKEYQAKDTVSWFASRNVILKAEEDGRMFPVTDQSETIVNCFLSEARRLNVEIETRVEVVSIVFNDNIFEVKTAVGEIYRCRRVIVTTGGNPRQEAYGFLKALGHSIKKPIPSLFTFNDRDKRFSDLMGVAVQNAVVRILTTRFQQSGPLLITHWGLSGPAVIRLSAWAAEYLYSVNYDFTASVSWIGSHQEESVRQFLMEQKNARSKQRIMGNPLYELPQRLWTRLCDLAEIPETKTWSDVSHKQVNKLLEYLIRCPFQIRGKTTFKEEFVTCGGVDLADVNIETMESRKQKGLFFAGEVLNIDGETGGFNFQAAWSTAFIAAKHVMVE